MSRGIQRLNWMRKKKVLRASEQKEEDRVAWREQAQTLDAGKLVFVKEDAFSQDAIDNFYLEALMVYF